MRRATTSSIRHITQSPDRHIATFTARCRGGVLFEVLLAVAIFAGAAAFTLGCMRSVLATLDRTRRQQQAVDLAQSTFAQLQAGLISIASLGDQGNSIAEGDHHDRASSATSPQFTIDVKVQRSEFTDLSLVELTVREQSTADDAAHYTLRQLVSLRSANVQIDAREPDK
jgi:hypothetical protein